MRCGPYLLYKGVGLQFVPVSSYSALFNVVCVILVQERFAKKNEAVDLRRAFDKLDSKGCAK
jgi:hypothetical protein